MVPWVATRTLTAMACQNHGTINPKWLESTLSGRANS